MKKSIKMVEIEECLTAFLLIERDDRGVLKSARLVSIGDKDKAKKYSKNQWIYMSQVGFLAVEKSDFHRIIGQGDGRIEVFSGDIHEGEEGSVIADWVKATIEQTNSSDQFMHLKSKEHENECYCVVTDQEDFLIVVDHFNSVATFFPYGDFIGEAVLNKIAAFLGIEGGDLLVEKMRMTLKGSSHD